jgi:hypothetical protein
MGAVRFNSGGAANSGTPLEYIDDHSRVCGVVQRLSQ